MKHSIIKKDKTCSEIARKLSKDFSILWTDKIFSIYGSHDPNIKGIYWYLYLKFNWDLSGQFHIGVNHSLRKVQQL